MTTLDIEPHIVLAGFWRRFFAAAIDQVIIAVAFGLVIVADIFLFHGELGSFEYYETTNTEIIEESIKPNDDGGNDLYRKYVETRRDYNGREAQFEIEETVSTGGSSTTTTKFWKMIDGDPDWGGKYETFTSIVMLIGMTAYFVLFWSSRHQATLGGMAMKYKVIDYDGSKIGMGRALARLLLVVPQFILVPLFLTIAFTRRKQGIHDMIAKTLVVRDISLPKADAHVSEKDAQIFD